MFMKNRIAGLAVLATLFLSGMAVAQDRDRDDNRDRDRWGYQDRDRDRDRDRDHDRNWDRDRDDHRFRGGDVARDWGSRDGADAARGDWRARKSFNPNPRGRYKHSDRGFDRRFGDLREYQEQYARAYHEGYEHAWQGGGWRR
jgi:hypothetical protein